MESRCDSFELMQYPTDGGLGKIGYGSSFPILPQIVIRIRKQQVISVVETKSREEGNHMRMIALLQHLQHLHF